FSYLAIVAVRCHPDEIQGCFIYKTFWNTLFQQACPSLSPHAPVKARHLKYGFLCLLFLPFRWLVLDIFSHLFNSFTVSHDSSLSFVLDIFKQLFKYVIVTHVYSLSLVLNVTFCAPLPSIGLKVPIVIGSFFRLADNIRRTRTAKKVVIFVS